MAENLKKFKYTALKKDGTRVKGTYEAANKKQLLEYLYENDLSPIYIDEITPFLDLQSLKEINIGGFPLKEKVFLVKQFSVMLSAGIPISKVISVLAAQTDYYPLKKILNEVYEDVSSGKSLSEAFSKHPELFDEITLALIEAGESSGTLDKIFKKLSKDYTQRQKITSAIKGAMMYPAVVSLVILAVLAFITFIIMPKLKTVFEDFNLKLPLITRLLLFVSDTFIKYIYVYIGLIVLAGFLFYRYAKSDTGKKTLDKIKMHLPLFGKLYKEYQVSVFARVMYLMLNAGVPILKSLELAKKSVSNFWYKLEIEELYDYVASGGKASELLLKSNIFPHIVGYMFDVGERSGQLDVVLHKLAQYYETEVMSVIKNISSLIQPVIILILGIVVGVIVVAIYLPLTQLATSIG